MDLLDENVDSAAIDTLAQSFGLSRRETEAVIGSVMPEIARRIERNTLSRGGVADVIAMVGAAGGQGGLAAIGSDEGRVQGNAFLEQIFGTRDASRSVATRASYASGIGSSIVQAMLPYIASMVMRALSRRLSGGLGDIMSKIPNMPSAGTAPAGTAPAGDGRIGGATQMPKPSGGGAPLPGPEGMQTGGRNPYGDLSDVIRRGGSSASLGGNPLWRIARNLIGGLLGFQSRGIMGWIMRMVVMRYGWSILRTILRRMFTGR